MLFVKTHFNYKKKMPLHCDEAIDEIPDIEDTVLPDYNEHENLQICIPTAQVKIHRRIRKIDIEPVSPTIQTSIIPGAQTICIVTWGCAHNSSDSEYMAGQLSAYGYKLTDLPEEADLWVLNSCTVKGPAEAHFRNMIEKGQRLGKHLVAAGCVPQGAPKTNYLKGLSVIGVHNIDRVVEVVEETLKGNSVRLFSKKIVNGKKIVKTDLELPKIRRNKFIEIIPISSGCLNECTYCKTKHARGKLRSYAVTDIVARAIQAFSEGVLELWLTSEDTGAYGRDIGASLPQLLWEIIAVTPKNCRIRIGMTNPPYIMEHLEEMAKILSHEKVYSFLHVPVQSGSDAVLGEMKREYVVSEFKHVISFLRERVPGVTIVTDVICGFPTETIEDFYETLNLCKELKFPSLYINQFYPRPGTLAALMRRIPAHEVKKRTKELSDWFQTYFPYTEKLGQIQEILVTELASDNNHYVGHNKFYEQVLVPKNDNFMGKMILVKIIDTKKHCMVGDPLPVNMQLIHKFCLKPASLIVFFFIWFLNVIFEFIKGPVQKLKYKEINS